MSMRLSIFAYHVSSIMNNEPGKFSLYPCAGVRAEIEIVKEYPELKGQIWDSVYINGKHCGNRHGGVSVFTEMVCKEKPEMIWD